nr:alanine--glyoxylate aminotransferase family protein [Actinomycetota bacterium]
PQSWYLDLSQIAAYTSGGEGGGGGARRYHHTAPISMIFALHAGLGVILEEGLRNAWERHAEAGKALQDGLEKRGFEFVAPVTNRLPELTTVWVPTGVDDAFVRRALLERYGIEIGGGVGPMAGKAWRIGCMGHTARLRNVAALLAALDEVITW